jgi:hypothetical protein
MIGYIIGCGLALIVAVLLWVVILGAAVLYVGGYRL